VIAQTEAADLADVSRMTIRSTATELKHYSERRDSE